MSQRIYIRLTFEERFSLEKILNSTIATKHDKLKAQVLLLTDVGEHGPGLLSKDIVTKLSICISSIVRIRQTYAKNSSITEVFSHSGLSKKKNKINNANRSKKINKRQYVEINSDSNEMFLIEHVKCRVSLTKEERNKLESIHKKGNQTKRSFNRAKILLLADEGIEGPALSDEEISNKLDVSISTVARVRTLLITKGQIDDVLNFKHSNAGRRPKIDGIVQATIVSQVCSAPPEGRCKWTVRLLADRLVKLEIVDSISHTAVANALKKTNLSLGNARSG